MENVKTVFPVLTISWFGLVLSALSFWKALHSFFERDFFSAKFEDPEEMKLYRE
jgi:hypothetical protein